MLCSAAHLLLAGQYEQSCISSDRFFNCVGPAQHMARDYSGMGDQVKRI